MFSQQSQDFVWRYTSKPWLLEGHDFSCDFVGTDPVVTSFIDLRANAWYPDLGIVTMEEWGGDVSRWKKRSVEVSFERKEEFLDARRHELDTLERLLSSKPIDAE